MGKLVILCVDDEKMVLDSLKGQLKRSFGNDYLIEIAESGEDALEIFHELLEEHYEIPVIIADYIMPEIKGDELLKRIHDISPDTLKIMLTGQASTQAVTNAVNYANLYRYMAKPWEEHDLILTVTEAIRSYSQDKQIELQNKKLRESEEKYRGIFENAIEGIFQSTPSGRFISVNPAMVSYLGYDSPEDFIRNISDIKKQLYVVPERRDELFNLLQNDGIITDFEVNLFRKDGSKMWGLVKARPVYNEKGEMIYMEGMFQDITRRKENEEALLRAYEKRRELEHIITHSPVVVFLWKNEPGWPVEFVSENVSQFGYAAEDFTSGRISYSDIICPEDLAYMTQEMECFNIEGKCEFTQNYRIFTKTGEIRWTENRIWVRRNEAGDITHYQGILLDITIRKEKEKAEREWEIAQAANKKIMDSLQYARIIQKSLLPNLKGVEFYLPDSFFLWKPRDIVGGDLYYTECFEDGIVIAVIDCTGHGVPGAFMTMIASSGLRRITRTEKCHDPAEILKWLNFIIKTSLQQDTEYALSDDGLDAAICFAEPEKDMLTFAGAHLPLYYIHNKEIQVIKGDRQSIGYKRSDLGFNYTNHEIKIEKGMSFYLASDGFIDQLGGTRGRRFGSRRFRELLLNTASSPFNMQEEILFQTLNKYKGEYERIDDVTVAGFGFDTKGKKDRRQGLPDSRECFIERRRRKI